MSAETGVLSLATATAGRFELTPDTLQDLSHLQRDVMCAAIRNLLNQNERSNRLTSAICTALETHADLETRPAQ